VGGTAAVGSYGNKTINAITQLDGYEKFKLLRVNAIKCDSTKDWNIYIIAQQFADPWQAPYTINGDIKPITSNKNSVFKHGK